MKVTEYLSAWNLRTCLLSSVDFADDFAHNRPEYAADVTSFSQEIRGIKKELMSSFEESSVPSSHERGGSACNPSVINCRILGGFTDQDISNSPFTPEELAKISESLQDIRSTISRRTDIRPDQLDFFSGNLVKSKKAQRA